MLINIFPHQKPDSRLLFWLSCASGARGTSPVPTSSCTDPGTGDAATESSLTHDCHSSFGDIQHTKSSKLPVVVTSELLLTAITDKKKKKEKMEGAIM